MSTVERSEEEQGSESGYGCIGCLVIVVIVLACLVAIKWLWGQLLL